ncbi:hypothetical protein [Bordetella avium]|uniref:hypothetical protein n=1 Tax=Bordetella avium TaxID=521 RepID=UPI000FD866BA|nr:hypothetical protein [Bordetella avium]AZY51392.1 hypothetical protein C0J07_01875 [Bordetella avium]
MSRQRTINDQIWRSNRLSGCTVEVRYALFYFLTSPFSNVIGAYEVVLRVAASEMGWDPDSQLMPVMRRLIDAGILDFDPQANYIWIKDWWDHNSAKMAVATTLRKRTLEQIAALPRGWRDAYVNDFIDRLPTEDPLRKFVQIIVLALIILFAQRKSSGLGARLAGGIAFDAVTFRSMAQGIGNVVNPKTTRRDMQSGMMVTAGRTNHMIAGNTMWNPAYRQHVLQNMGKNWGAATGGSVNGK